MILNSFDFFVIFPFLFLFYWIIPLKLNTIRNIYLLLVSYVLYMNWKPSLAIILLFVSLVTYVGALVVTKYGSTKKKIICLCFVLLAVFPLLIFKYYNFINENISDLLCSIHLKFSLPGLNYAIPVGISFFTFQALGYFLDVYHNRVQAEKNIFCYLLFVSFFPQVTSGPISSCEDLMPQFKHPRIFQYEMVRNGLRLLLWGVFLKAVLADRLGIFVDTVYGNYDYYNGITCFCASISYTIQIYCDFAGYSLLAIGVSKTLGFDLKDNFNRPYFATSITDFWKRWHISLTKWLTRHIYISLGGNRCSTIRQYINIMITFLVSGLWHGANWTFVVWGVIHGFFQVIEKLLGLDPKGKYGIIPVDKPIVVKGMIICLRIFVTFLVVNFAWIFFRMPSIDDALGIIYKIFSLSEGVSQNMQFVLVLSLSMFMLFFSEFSEEFLNIRFNPFSSTRKVVRWSAYLFVLVLTLLYGVFDATQFIYVSF